jgi:hypothetical protein
MLAQQHADDGPYKRDDAPDALRGVGSELHEIRVYQLLSLFVIMLSNPWGTIDA